jgi:hypothetical protein
MDYEIVILLFGERGFGFSNFVPWSAQNRPPTKHHPSPSHLKESTMKTTNLFAAVAATLAFAASGAATAAIVDSYSEFQPPQALSSTTTRAAVKAELLAARAAGQLDANEARYYQPEVIVSQRSRAEVRSETLAAIASGELRAQAREGYDSNFSAPLQARGNLQMASIKR